MENNFIVALMMVHDLSTNDKSNLIRESNLSLPLLELPPLMAIASSFPKLSSGRAFDKVVSAIEGKINSAIGSSCSVGWDVVGCVVGYGVGRIEGEMVGGSVGENVLPVLR